MQMNSMNVFISQPMNLKTVEVEKCKEKECEYYGIKAIDIEELEHE